MNTLQKLRPFTLSSIIILILAVGVLTGCGPRPTPIPPPTSTLPPTDTPLPELKFNYHFRVTDSIMGRAVEGAKITLWLTDQPPKHEFADTNGYATFQIDSKNAGQSAKILIEAGEFQPQTHHVTITRGDLPYEIRLVPVGEFENVKPTPPTVIPTDTTQPPTPAPPTQAPTETPSLTPTQTSIPATATSTPSPTATSPPDLDTATAVLHSSIFAEPNAESEELAYLEPGDQVTVLATTTNRSWLLIRSDRGIEGFVAASRFELSPGLNPPTLTPSPTPWASPIPAIVPTYAPLSIDFWELTGTGRCAGGQWYKRIYIRGQGGDLNYTYYYFNDVDRQVQHLAERQDDSFTFEVAGTGTTALRLTGEVHSGDSQTARRMIVVEPQLCP